MLRKWERIPELMRTEETLKYYNILKQKKCALFFKRIFDIVVSFIMLMALLPIFIVLSVAIKIDSKGPVFYRQVRVTQYGKEFRIFKFRTMVHNADKIGSQVTVNNDSRITRVGRFIRKYRLDEICQLIDVLRGTMTFVGTRPEVPKYVEKYTPEMMVTLLMPAGVTSLASIYFKNEAELLESADNVEKSYVEKVLPAKMYYNLKAIENFGFWNDIKIMFMTFFAVCGKKYAGDYIMPEEKPETVSAQNAAQR
ncbi:MAG TPA: sugar transferase [Spirochaetia bacterium]|nr:sugar transferase [Spirochaetia bacterium]